MMLLESDRPALEGKLSEIRSCIIERGKGITCPREKKERQTCRDRECVCVRKAETEIARQRQTDQNSNRRTDRQLTLTDEVRERD